MELKENLYMYLIRNNGFSEEILTTIIKLSKQFNVSENRVSSAINKLIKEERIVLNGRKLINNSPLFQARYVATVKGNGYVSIPETAENIFVANKSTALNNDIVEVGYVYNKGEKQAFVSRVVKRENTFLIGQVAQNHEGQFYFLPEDLSLRNNVIIPQDEMAKLAVGKKCSINATFIENKDKCIIVGKIDKIFGKAGDPIVENQVIAYEHGFVKDFTKDIEKEVAKISAEITQEEINKRLDLRDKRFVTIDPPNCKDMDDAVYAERTDKGYRVYVAVADVAHYVRKNSKIDKEAYLRGTSCYLGDGVYPMLPEKLSNDICSLNENVDRLSLCAIVDIDKKGQILNYEINKAVIKNNHKLSYDVVDLIYDKVDNMHIKYADITKDVDLMFEIADVLVNMRHNRGSLSFNSTDPSYTFSEDRCTVLEVKSKTDLKSTKLIESFMILANEAVGLFFIENNYKTLFSIHDKPNANKYAELAPIFKDLDVPFIEQPSHENLQKTITEISGKGYEEALTTMLLKTMSKAKYHPENIGHFGLASKNYIHFTSPIRRYPDTFVHRQITDYLEHGKMEEIKMSTLEEMGRHLTEREISAANAEVKSDSLLKAMWASNNIDRVFNATVHKISQAGITAKIGLVDVFIPSWELVNGKLDEYVPNQTFTRMHNKLGNVYTLGDDINVKIQKVDMQNKTILGTGNVTKNLDKDTGLEHTKQK